MHARHLLRHVVRAALVGGLTVSAAWAAGGLAPVPTAPPPQDAVSDAVGGNAEDGAADGAGLAPLDAGPEQAVAGGAPGAAADRPVTVPEVAQRHRGQLGGDRVLAGAAKVSIAPRPDDHDGTWETEDCATFGEDAAAGVTHVADFRVRWPENPNCIYMGGYGIGPMNPVTSFDEEYGLWVRAAAFSDGTDTAVLAILDGVSYMAEYANLCDGCGAVELAEELGAELGFDPAGFLLASTHSHTAPDFIAGWGGVPDWYMRQVADAIRTATREAVATMEPAVVETGEVVARPHNAERRDFYRSAENDTMGWLRAYVPLRPGEGPSGARTIVTMGAYGAHPVTADESTGVAHPDFPGVFDRAVEQAYGGVGMFFQTGLGNMSPRGSTEELGNALAALVPPIGTGSPVAGTDVAVGRTTWDQPVTNSGLTALGAPGFFDRPFAHRPATLRTGKSPDRQPCVSASAVAVHTGVSVARIGDVTIAGAPGETFSNLSNTIQEKAPGPAFPLAQVNDGLGYIMQSFETDHLGRQAVGFVGEVAEYEDAYSIDHCFGDHVLEATIALIGQLHS